VISVDTKEEGADWQIRNSGREYQRKGQPEKVKVHDFIDPEVPKAIPYGVYGRSKELAGSTLAATMTRPPSPWRALRAGGLAWGRASTHGAKELLMCADGGGSNGYRIRLWKIQLQRFADTRVSGHRLPSSARDQQVEQNRAPDSSRTSA